MFHAGRSPARQLLLAAAVLGLIAVAWRAGASGAAAPLAAPAPPTAVAIVDFTRVYDALKEKSDRGTRLQERFAPVQAELKELETKIGGLRTDVNNTKPLSTQWFDANLALKEAQDLLQSKTNAANDRLNLFVGNNNREIYMKFLGTVQFLANRDGWDLVLLDDRTMQNIPDLASAPAVLEAVKERSILFAGPRADITGVVIDQMNNDYGAKPIIDRTPPPPPPPPVAKQ